MVIFVAPVMKPSFFHFGDLLGEADSGVGRAEEMSVNTGQNFHDVRPC